jgi:hypothetical protein
MTMKPQTFKHISRAIDKNGVHHLDALDDYGRHWYATMQQKEETWLTYTQQWELRTH